VSSIGDDKTRRPPESQGRRAPAAHCDYADHGAIDAVGDRAALSTGQFDPPEVRPQEKKLVQYFGDAANAQIYVDRHRADALKISLKDVAAFLEAQGVVAAAFPESEVMQAAARLKR
jgi:hypothetical protein